MAMELNPLYKKFDGDLLLTTACPVECDFCVYSCTASKEKEKWMPESTIRRVAEQYSKNDIGIRIGGGEPFYDMKKLERCIDILLEYYKDYEILVITSGFWATDEEQTNKILKMLNSKGIDRLVISIDKFHLKRVPFTNVKRIVENARKYSIDIVLRITLPGIPSSLVEEIAELITKHDLKIETHGVGIVGKAEKIHVEADQQKKEELLAQKIREYAKRFNASEDVKNYKTYCAKRSQTEFGSGFFPTTFPNGNIYGCSMCCKLAYMGNINRENMGGMIRRLKKRIPGVNLFGNGCNELTKYSINGDKCELCKNLPFEKGVWNEEYIGRKYVKIYLNNLKIPSDTKHELLLSFQIKEKDLNKKTGATIIKFLRKLKKENVRFKVSKPLPRCLFGHNVSEVKEFSIPKNCSECNELFEVSNEIKLCSIIKKNEIKLSEIKGRYELHNHFINLNVKCDENCLYLSRNLCSGVCNKNE